ncbi:CDP-diacylglycerol--glycerol-3-phosphate 3-phosphatidyltransferase [Sulfuriroseicoccus oceanibius]|uniref:CDP-diacylglycerol--glycerol-3-phosphate 3-phosphatidyltransferase n=1 Tax=Sulfuriroseicoccus oceanibius TaxID=2707525 RepID=A0A6B3L6P6_9BACT|nr:CDP-diacylglycerol--glycerol-3-phosphate 3-phosphatidyltransferase [Sulfuriroseicoccus oceanibius]QQL44947.1 CDP-diacylglycerol--glycerol-3-phosphate 3-phosphatidyltransferase [Sulfuriroseicoccus oceanibius]
MNIPNQLTLLRIVLSVIFVIVLSVDMANAYLWALIIFAIASITDFLDGHLARKWNLVTDFGKLMDPLADKILVAAALVLMVQHQDASGAPLLPAWFVIVILFREFLVTGVRMLALSSKTVIAADGWGKLKTIFQIVLICVILAERATVVDLGIDLSIAEPFLGYAIDGLFWVVLALTVYSGAGYFKGFLKTAEFK